MTWLREKINKDLIAHLKCGVRPWVNPNADFTMQAVNPATGKRYRGGNRLILGMVANGMGYADQRWLTLRQANTKFDAHVKKGERASYVEYWLWTANVPTGEMDLATGQPAFKTVSRKEPKVFMAKVFNAQQIAGLPDSASERCGPHPFDIIDEMVKATGVLVTYGHVAYPQFNRDEDTIQLPAHSSFTTSEAYYSALLEQLSWWNLSKSTPKLEEYLRSEHELVVDIATTFLAGEIGLRLPDRPCEHTDAWVDLLTEDRHAFFQCAGIAERVANHALQFCADVEYQALDEVELQEFSFDLESIASELDEGSQFSMK